MFGLHKTSLVVKVFSLTVRHVFIAKKTLVRKKIVSQLPRSVCCAKLEEKAVK